MSLKVMPTHLHAGIGLQGKDQLLFLVGPSSTWEKFANISIKRCSQILGEARRTQNPASLQVEKKPQRQITALESDIHKGAS